MEQFIKKMTHNSLKAIESAGLLAQKHRNPCIETYHLFIEILKQKTGIPIQVLILLNIKPELIIQDLEKNLLKLPKIQGDSTTPFPSNDVTQIFTQANQESKQQGDSYISTEHFILSVFSGSYANKIRDIFINHALNKDVFLKSLKKLLGDKKIIDPHPENKINTLKKYTCNLIELAEQDKLDPVIGRDQEIRRLIQVLSRRTKNNPVLIGEPGVGKTAIAEGLALRILNKDVPEILYNKQILSLDLASMLAGAKYQGEFEERLKSLISEVISSNGKIILFIDEIHTLVGAGQTGTAAMDASQILKPALAKGELRTIGATTLNEYRKFIEKDQALERRFQTVIVKEPSEEDALTILRGIKDKYEVHHGVRITDAALKTAVKMSHRYLRDRFLPDKAIDLIDEAASRLNIEIHSVPSSIDENQRKIVQLQVEQQALSKEKGSQETKRCEQIHKILKDLEEKTKVLKIQWEKEKSSILKLRSLKKEIEIVKQQITKAERDAVLDQAAKLKYDRLPSLTQQIFELEQQAKKQDQETLLKEEVDSDEISAVISQWTHIPLKKILKTESEKLLNMDAYLKKRVLGQDSALSVISDSVRRSRANIGDPSRPVGSFLFLGPTGVGKTETAKALAEFLFDSEKSCIRIDMSEYMEKHSVARLIGAPPGYVGFEEGGQLTEKIRRQAYSVVLIDEIEKAHPDVFNILLQILDEGHLTDGQGRNINFKNTILIITSNLGSEILMKQDLTKQDKHNQMTLLLQKHFKPEFLNRIDEIVFYNTLESQHIKNIIKMHIQQIETRLNNNSKFVIDNQAYDFLFSKSYNPAYGARPVRRAIQKFLLNPLAQKILKGDIKNNSQIHVTVKEDQLVFTIQG